MRHEGRNCRECQHPWTEHIKGQPCPTNGEIAGRVMMPSVKAKWDACVALPKERIIAAAIQVEGMTLSLPDYMVTPACQGFLTSTGRFVNRVQAKQIAHMAGQPQLRPEGERHDRDLFSEDLW